MLELAVTGVELRHLAARTALRHGCKVTARLEFLLSDFPLFPAEDSGGIEEDMMSAMRVMASRYLGWRQVVGYVKGESPYCFIGVTKLGTPRIIIMPATVSIPACHSGLSSEHYVSAVGVYALRGRHKSEYMER